MRPKPVVPRPKLYSSIPLKCSELYRKTICRVAALRGIPAGELVREALDAYVSPDEYAAAEKFFTRCVSQGTQEAVSDATPAGR